MKMNSEFALVILSALGLISIVVVVFMAGYSIAGDYKRKVECETMGGLYVDGKCLNKSVLFDKETHNENI